MLRSVATIFVMVYSISMAKAAEGPGMILTFNSDLRRKAIMFSEAFSSSGNQFPHPAYLASNRRNRDPMSGGATEGAAPDGRVLPEWVEFVWREPIDDVEYSREQLLALPHHRSRIPVKSRVPQEIVDEVIESKRKREGGKLPDKALWLYFIWRENGIQFRWKLKSDCCGLLREGGDEYLPETSN